MLVSSWESKENQSCICFSPRSIRFYPSTLELWKCQMHAKCRESLPVDHSLPTTSPHNSSNPLKICGAHPASPHGALLAPHHLAACCRPKHVLTRSTFLSGACPMKKRMWQCGINTVPPWQILYEAMQSMQMHAAVKHAPDVFNATLGGRHAGPCVLHGTESKQIVKMKASATTCCSCETLLGSLKQWCCNSFDSCSVCS